jgi:predicted DNA-binding mobile mystery protein A
VVYIYIDAHDKQVYVYIDERHPQDLTSTRITMDAQTNRFMRSQLMRKLEIVQQAVRESPRPREGWIRAIRESLRMTGAQLGKRLGVIKQRVAQIEKDELLGNVTLKTVSQVAEAMNCSFVYWVVPKTSLEEIVRGQAKKIAEASLSQTSLAMTLEGQAISDQDKAELIDGTVDTILSDNAISLWDDE